MACSNYLTVNDHGFIRSATPEDNVYYLDPRDFGADSIIQILDWWGSGYDHYIASAFHSGGGTISWNEVREEVGPRDVVNIHMTDKASPNDKPFSIWTEDDE